jgi:hypothetical protein
MTVFEIREEAIRSDGPAEAPSNGPPGSEEKIQDLMERFARKRELWHHSDAKHDLT